MADTEAHTGVTIRRGKDGRFTQTMAAAERAALACRLREEGHSYSEVARKLGYAGPGPAYRAVMRALRRTQQESADALRTLEVERLDRVALAAWQVYRTGTDRAKIGALNTLVRVSESRRKLLGLNAPTHNVYELMTTRDIDAEIERLSTQIAANQHQDCVPERRAIEGRVIEG